MPAVSRNDEVCADIKRACGILCPYADNFVMLDNEVSRLSCHQQVKRRKSLRLA